MAFSRIEYPLRPGECRCVHCGCTDSHACPPNRWTHSPCRWLWVNQATRQGGCNSPVCVTKAYAIASREVAENPDRFPPYELEMIVEPDIGAIAHAIGL